MGYPFAGSDEVGLTWILPVNPTYNCVLAWEGEYIGKRIVKEQKDVARCS